MNINAVLWDVWSVNTRNNYASIKLLLPNIHSVIKLRNVHGHSWNIFFLKQKHWNWKLLSLLINTRKRETGDLGATCCQGKSLWTLQDTPKEILNKIRELLNSVWGSYLWSLSGLHRFLFFYLLFLKSLPGKALMFGLLCFFWMQWIWTDAHMHFCICVCPPVIHCPLAICTVFMKSPINYPITSFNGILLYFVHCVSQPDRTVCHMSLNESCFKLSGFHPSELLMFISDGRNVVKLFEVNVSLQCKPQG